MTKGTLLDDARIDDILCMPSALLACRIGDQGRAGQAHFRTCSPFAPEIQSAENSFRPFVREYGKSVAARSSVAGVKTEVCPPIEDCLAGGLDSVHSSEAESPAISA